MALAAITKCHRLGGLKEDGTTYDLVYFFAVLELGSLRSRGWPVQFPVRVSGANGHLLAQSSHGRERDGALWWLFLEGHYPHNISVPLYDLI